MKIGIMNDRSDKKTQRSSQWISQPNSSLPRSTRELTTQTMADSLQESRLKWSSLAGVKQDEKLPSAVILSVAQNPPRLLPAAIPSTHSSEPSTPAIPHPN